MRYTYTAAWALVGGVSLREEDQPIILVNSERVSVVLTRDPDSLLSRVDEAAAVGRVILGNVLGNRDSSEFSAGLAAEIAEIRSERKQKYGTSTVLLAQLHGDVNAEIEGPHNEFDTFVMAFDAIDKESLIQRHQADVEAIKIAVAIESKDLSRFAKIAEGVILFPEAGKPIYSISFHMSGDVSVLTPATPEMAERISARYLSLNRENDLGSVGRLFSQMAEYDSDRLKAFLSGWAALEILIAKSFKEYEQSFLSAFTDSGQADLRDRFLSRIKDVMKDKYRLTDKFIAVTAVLFPNISDEVAREKYATFCRLKRVRDSILHGESFSEKGLPIEELGKLIREYVVARLAFRN